MSTPQQPLIPGKYYHVFNKSVGGELLFKNEGNYLYFLEKYKKYVAPFADTLGYCLMPTHFHFLLAPLNKKTLEGFKNLAGQTQSGKPCEGENQASKEGCEPFPVKVYEGCEPLVDLSKPGRVDLSRKFSHLFNCYAQAYNKQNHRSGSLFKNRFKRVLINDEEHLRTAIIYIHLNPSHHHVEKYFTDWKYSSYRALAGNGQTLVNKAKVLELFEGTENFIFCHQQKFELNTGLCFS